MYYGQGCISKSYARAHFIRKRGVSKSQEFRFYLGEEEEEEEREREKVYARKRSLNWVTLRRYRAVITYDRRNKVWQHVWRLDEDERLSTKLPMQALSSPAFEWGCNFNRFWHDAVFFLLTHFCISFLQCRLFETFGLYRSVIYRHW